MSISLHPLPAKPGCTLASAQETREGPLGFRKWSQQPSVCGTDGAYGARTARGTEGRRVGCSRNRSHSQLRSSPIPRHQSEVQSLQLGLFLAWLPIQGLPAGRVLGQRGWTHCPERPTPPTGHCPPAPSWQQAALTLQALPAPNHGHVGPPCSHTAPVCIRGSLCPVTSGLISAPLLPGKLSSSRKLSRS